MTSARTPDPADLLRAARAAAHESAEHLRSLDRSDLAREEKTSSHDIVTEHDRRCEEIIVASLRRDVPGCRIVGEEGGERAGADTAGGGVTFYVDPIDGTSNFAAGMPLFCVSIGAAIEDALVAGVIDVPLLGQVFTAGPDGARLNDRPLAPRATHAPREALVLSGWPTIGDVEADEAGASAGRARMLREIGSVRTLGSAAIELAWVAAGWADATMLGSIHSWDVAAGFLLVEQAGGSIRTWPGRGPVDAPAHERPAYVACTGPERLAVLDELMDEVQERRDGAPAM